MAATEIVTSIKSNIITVIILNYYCYTYQCKF